MNNILKIFKRDLKNIFTNIIATIIVLGLMIVPSFYSLINIKACYDPYSSENTKNIKIAVINKDKGTTFHDKKINLGDKIIENLKDNDKMGWTFVDKKTAENGLIMEKYYASIEIPEDFSYNITTLVKGKVIKPKLIYTVNEKKNAIAPKMTDAGVKALKIQIDDNITKTISGIIIRISNEIGIDIENNRADLRRIADEIYELDENMPELEQILDQSIEGTKSASALSEQFDKMIPNLDETLDITDSFILDTQDNLGKLEFELSDISIVLKEDLIESERLIDNLNTELYNLDENIIPEVYEKSLYTAKDTNNATIETIDELTSKLKALKKFINEVSEIDIPDFESDDETQSLEAIENIRKEAKKQAELLKDIQDNLEGTNDSISDILDKLDLTRDKLDVLSNRIDEDLEDIENGEKLDTQTLTDTRKVLEDTHTLLSDTIDNYDSKIVSTVSESFDSINNILDSTTILLDEGRDTLPEIQNLTNILKNTSDLSTEELNKLKEKFPDLKSDVHELARKVKEFDDEDKLDELLDAINNGYEDQSDFMASAVEIEDNRLFPWPNYGSTVTPFYTILCLWVGALLLSSLVATDAADFEDGTEIKPYEKYFGRLLLYLFIGVFQSLVATLGALILLKSYCLHPIMCILYTSFVSIVFIIIVYTGVSLFRNVGKVIAIILLVIQVAGAGGNFPIEVAPKIFQIIFSYLPFTYAISGMRQIMAGIVYEILIKDILILSLFAVISLLIGVSSKKFINNKINNLSHRLMESGILGH